MCTPRVGFNSSARAAPTLPTLNNCAIACLLALIHSEGDRRREGGRERCVRCARNAPVYSTPSTCTRAAPQRSTLRGGVRAPAALADPRASCVLQGCTDLHGGGICAPLTLIADVECACLGQLAAPYRPVGTAVTTLLSSATYSD